MLNFSSPAAVHLSILPLLILCACKVAPEASEGPRERTTPALAPGARAASVHPLPSPPEGAPVAAVLDESGGLCQELLGVAARQVHIVCDPSETDPQGTALRRGLARLRDQLAPRKPAPSVVLFASPGRAGDARGLIAQEPSFFSRAVVQSGGDQRRVEAFGPSFLGHAGSRGTKLLILVGVDSAQIAPWTRQARRVGLELEVLAAWPGAEGVLARSLRELPAPSGVALP